MKNAIVGVIAIVCIVGSAGGTYLFVDQMKQSEIDNEVDKVTSQYESEINDLEEIDKNRQEFDRLILRGILKEEGYLNQGWAGAYDVEARYHYENDMFDWGEIYYSYAQDYYEYASEAFREANIFYKQAKNYATNDKTLEIINKYIEYMNQSKELANLDYSICDNSRLACYYYNLSEWDFGDEKIDEIGDQIDQRKDMIDDFNDVYNEIELLLESSWIV